MEDVWQVKLYEPVAFKGGCVAVQSRKDCDWKNNDAAYNVRFSTTHRLGTGRERLLIFKNGGFLVFEKAGRRFCDEKKLVLW